MLAFLRRPRTQRLREYERQLAGGDLMTVLVEPRADARERPPQIRLVADNLTQIVHMQETGDNSGRARHAAPQIPHRAREARALDGELGRRARVQRARMSTLGLCGAVIARAPSTPPKQLLEGRGSHYTQ